MRAGCRCLEAVRAEAERLQDPADDSFWRINWPAKTARIRRGGAR